MKKPVVIFCGLIFLSLIFTGCGGSDSEYRPCREILETLRDESEYGFDTVYSVGDETFDESFDNLYAFEKRLVDDSAIMFIEEGGLADEISIFHVIDSDDIKIVRDKLDLRIQSRLQIFEAYKPAEAGKVENAEVMVNGNYVALIISADNEMIEASIRKIIAN